MNQKKITLRQLISSVIKNNQLNNVYNYIFQKESKYADFNIRKFTLESVEIGYEYIINELFKKRKNKCYKHPIVVLYGRNYLNDVNDISHEVVFKNNKYVKPKKGLLPWGGKNHPKGYYNCNDLKHNEYFAFGFLPWNKIIDTTVIDKSNNLKSYELLAEILWELSFYGYTEKQQKEYITSLKKTLKERIKECKIK